MKCRILASLIITTVFSIFVPSHPLAAQCYGDAVTSYGCTENVSSQTYRGGSLEQFGGTRRKIIPNMGYEKNSYNDVISPDERRRMLRDIILQRRTGNSFINRAYRASIQNSGRSIRRSGGVTSRSAGNGSGMRGGIRY
jgi:hypothetical protein